MLDLTKQAGTKVEPPLVLVEGVLKARASETEVVKFEHDVSVYNAVHMRSRPRDRECLIVGRDLESSNDKEVVVLIDRRTKLLNLRHKITRVGINAENDQHLFSLW